MVHRIEAVVICTIALQYFIGNVAARWNRPQVKTLPPTETLRSWALGKYGSMLFVNPLISFASITML
jgi:hypothetical protein